MRTADAIDPIPPDSPIYAGLVTRMIALMLDTVLIDLAAVVVSGAVLVVLSVFSVSGEHGRPVLIVLGSVLFVVWVVSYFVVLWTTTGQTIGSRVMEIQVVRSDGSRLKPRHALVRLAGIGHLAPALLGLPADSGEREAQSGVRCDGRHHRDRRAQGIGRRRSGHDPLRSPIVGEAASPSRR